MDIHMVYLKAMVLGMLLLAGCADAEPLSKQRAQEFADNIVCAFSQAQRSNGACWCFVQDTAAGVSMTLAPKEFCR